MTRRTLACGVWWLGVLGGVAAAQDTATLRPIECWTRTSTNAVRVGEPFTLLLTCAVVETAATTVVPDEARLDPGALQAPPFEVVSGARAQDVRTPAHRYFQYEYTLRFIGEQIGADLEVPGPTISYRVQSRVSGGAAVEGRDRQYLVRAQRVRILAQVPAGAGDIHEPLPDTFRDMSARRFRARAMDTAGWLLVGSGALVALWAIAALVSRPRPGEQTAPRAAAPPGSVLRAVSRELAAVRRARQVERWSGALAARALAALRLAAAYGSGGVVTQLPATAGAEAAPGQIRVVSGRLRRRALLVSAAATSGDADLTSAMAPLAAAAYGRSETLPDTALDEALERGSAGVRRVARQFTAPARLRRQLARTVVTLRERAWGR